MPVPALLYGRRAYLDALDRRVLVYDGAMGTNIQRHHLTPEDFGGAALEGCNDHLVLTRPDVIQGIHEKYFGAGCDVTETNTFNGAPVSGNRLVYGPRL